MRRFLGGLLVVAVALAAVLGGVLLLQSRDDADVGGGAGPGEKIAARCPDEPAGVTRDARRLSEDQIRQVVSLGNQHEDNGNSSIGEPPANGSRGW